MDVAIAFTLTRPETTELVTRGAARLMQALGHAPLLEFPLPNGRRADIMAMDARGLLSIVEVKSSVEDFRADRKWGEYAPYCDAFCFAVPPDFPREILPGDAGLIVADGFGGAILRHPPAHPLAPARRKALTLQFARLAAFRLSP